MQDPGPAAPRWLYGPKSDLFLGAGLLYMGFFALQMLAGNEMRSVFPLAFFPLITLVFGAPHYGATLLRVYQQRADRQRYVLFAGYATAVIAGLYVAGLHNYAIGSLLITLYVTWSPWHYSGQNYGVALLFFRRRGVAPEGGLKRTIYASFVLSYALVFVSIHSVGSSASYVPASYQGTVFEIWRLGFSGSLLAGLYLLLVVAYLASVGIALVGLLSRAPARDLAPGVLVMGTQALWFALPSIALHYGLLQTVDPLRGEFRDYAFTWIALGHFLQYLWITTFYSVESDSRRERARYFGTALCAGSLLWVVPALVASPMLLGELPFNMGLMALTAAMINLHHFVLDGAIWKLRDGPVARALLRQSSAATSATTGGRWHRPLLVFGALCVAFSLFTKLDVIQAERRGAAGDASALASTQQRRAWFARSHPAVVLSLARERLLEGDLEGARSHAEWSLSLYPTPGAHIVLGMVAEKSGRLSEAAGHFEDSLALDPDRAITHARLGSVQLQQGNSAAGRASLARARQLAPDDPRVADFVQTVRRREGVP